MLDSVVDFKQFLHKQIPNAQKDTDDVTVFLRLLDLQAQKLLVKRW